MSYLIDSDWLIDAFHGVPRAVDALDGIANDKPAISIISVGEIFEGAWNTPEPAEQLRSLRIFMRAYPVIPLSEPVMETFARTRAHLRRQGQMIADLDLLIAATAITHNLTLITRNRRHFERVPDLVLYPTT